MKLQTSTAIAVMLSASWIAAPQVRQQVQTPAQGGSLEPLVRYAFATGFGGPLSGPLCKALGVTSDGQTLPVEQLSAKAGDVSRSFNVSRHRGTLDIILSRRTGNETKVFLASPEGVLTKVVASEQGSAFADIPADVVGPEFEREKAWWLDTWLSARVNAPKK